MNEQARERPLAERVALAIQDLHGNESHDRWNTLLRIDNRAEAAEAPFQFDAVHGVLHRRGCRAIPLGARSAVYSLWRVGPDELKRACERCRPVPEERATPNETERTDLLFGLISVIDQFGGVLKERGKDYQKTDEGRQITAQWGRFYRALGRREKEVLDTVLSSLEALIGKIREADERLNADEPRKD